MSQLQYNIQQVLQDLHNCCSRHWHFVATCSLRRQSLQVSSLIVAPCCMLQLVLCFMFQVLSFIAVAIRVLRLQWMRWSVLMVYVVSVIRNDRCYELTRCLLTN